MSNLRVGCSATRIHCGSSVVNLGIERSTYLFNDVGAELLNRESAYIALELTNDSITEPAVVEIKDVLNDLKENKLLTRRIQIRLT